MHEVDLKRIDLNLLVMLQALIEERNVTRAARRLGMSQPAASRALARLRRQFSDALLVDGPGGYVLSARAESIAPMLRRLLKEFGDILEARPFVPATAAGTVRLITTDLHAAAIAPWLLARLSGDAPGLDLHILPPSGNVIQAIEDDLADAIIGYIEEAPAGIRSRTLYHDGFVTLMRTGHPASRNKLTLARYLALDHIVVSITGTGPAPVDERLAEMGRSRRVKVRVPGFLAAVEIAARSDLVMTLPETLARTAAGIGRFTMLPPPLNLGRFPMNLLWHTRHQDASRHAWLRQAIVEAANNRV